MTIIRITTIGITMLKYTKPLRKYEEGGSTTSVFAMKSLGIDPMTGKELYINREWMCVV